jgi:hypothetical protein
MDASSDPFLLTIHDVMLAVLSPVGCRGDSLDIAPEGRFGYGETNSLLSRKNVGDDFILERS